MIISCGSCGRKFKDLKVVEKHFKGHYKEEQIKHELSFKNIRKDSRSDTKAIK